MNCPVCNLELKMSERHDVEIDYCPKCRGVWLDRGELDKIIERAAGDRVAPVEAERRVQREEYPPAAGYDRREYDKRHKKRSFLSDIFDFD